jgi:hypothetical protein
LEEVEALNNEKIFLKSKIVKLLKNQGFNNIDDDE